MAQGDLRSPALTGTATSITNPMVANGAGTTVAVGDLIFAVIAEQTTNTLGAGSDNLGNTYTALTATVTGGITYRGYYSRATVAGSLTQVRVAATASSNNACMVAAVWEGPFKPSPLDKNPANTTADLTTPFTAPLSTTLAQADEVVVCFAGSNGSAVWTATAPLVKAAESATATIASVRLAGKKVAATTSTSGDFAGTNPTSIVLGTATFMLAQVLSDSRTETNAIADAVAGDVPAAAPKVQVSWVEAQAASIEAGSRAESAAAAESASAVWATAASRSESAGAAETIDAVKAYGVSLSESAAAGHSQSVTSAEGVSRLETAAAGHSQTVTSSEGVSRAESAAIAETVGRSLLISADRTEAATPDHTQSVGPIAMAAALIETAAITEAIVTGLLGAAVETAGITDIVATGAMTFAAARTETAASADSADALLYFVRSLTETAAIADARGVLAEMGVSCSETAGAVDRVAIEGEGGGAWVKHAGVWKQAAPYVKHNGVWKVAKVYVKDDATWKLVA